MTAHEVQPPSEVERSAPGEIEALVQAFSACGADRGLYYLSTPITTGVRELQLLDRLNCATRAELQSLHKQQWLTDVVQPNERDATLQADLFAETVALGLLVVNPARINLPHWGQLQYDALWARLLRTFPVTLVATPGWEFSRGARLELQLAIDLDLSVKDVTGRPLSVSDIFKTAVAADQQIRVNNWDRFKDVSLPVMRDRSTTATKHPVARLDTTPDEAFARQVFVWLARERNYQLNKFGVVADDEHTLDDGLSPDGWWARQLEMYFHRSRLLGLDNANGRQALAKYVATGCGLLESVVRTKGSLPAPGVPSGELS